MSSTDTKERYIPQRCREEKGKEKAKEAHVRADRRDTTRPDASDLCQSSLSRRSLESPARQISGTHIDRSTHSSRGHNTPSRHQRGGRIRKGHTAGLVDTCDRRTIGPDDCPLSHRTIGRTFSRRIDDATNFTDAIRLGNVLRGECINTPLIFSATHDIDTWVAGDVELHLLRLLTMAPSTRDNIRLGFINTVLLVTLCLSHDIELPEDTTASEFLYQLAEIRLSQHLRGSLTVDAQQLLRILVVLAHLALRQHTTGVLDMPDHCIAIDGTDNELFETRHGYVSACWTLLRHLAMPLVFKVLPPSDAIYRPDDIERQRQAQWLHHISRQLSVSNAQVAAEVESAIVTPDMRMAARFLTIDRKEAASGEFMSTGENNAAVLAILCGIRSPYYRQIKDIAIIDASDNILDRYFSVDGSSDDNVYADIASNVVAKRVVRERTAMCSDLLALDTNAERTYTCAHITHSCGCYVVSPNDVHCGPSYLVALFVWINAALSDDSFHEMHTALTRVMEFPNNEPKTQDGDDDIVFSYKQGV